MRKSLYMLAILGVVLTGIAVTGTGCGKKVAPQPPAVTPPPTPPVGRTSLPAPTISLTASPAAINRGQTSTISWRTSNATEVNIDGGIGTVEASGSRIVAPTASITFTARASGPGGSATAEARVTVSEATDIAIVPTSRPLSDGEWFVSSVKDVFFDYDSYELRDDARQSLIEDAKALNASDRKHIRITIEGHCDERGSEAYNLALGDKRANAARDFLIAQGVDPARIDAISYGEEKPFLLGHDEDAWRQNRRAHLVMR